jgi:hypothetical protein|tara:strand:+ start:516 stop:2207 length:1692 start_codon:yes stop_codon:yes gene_type:complete
MTSEQLLPLAIAKLLTPKGKALLGVPINILKIKDQIESLEANYGVVLASIAAASVTELNKAVSDSNKPTKELTAKEKIQAKKDQLGDIEEAKVSAAKKEYQKLKAKLKSEIPALETYKITGRIFDKTTGNVMSGVKVQLGINNDLKVEQDVSLPLEGIDDELLSTKISIDFSNLVFIPVGDDSTRSDDQGNFSILVSIPIIPKNQKSILDVGLMYSKSGFLPSTSPIINGDQTIKTNLQAASLTNTNKASEIIATQYRNTIDLAQDAVNNLALSAFEKILTARKLSINVVVDVVKTKMLPLVIQMLIQFGISKLSESNRKTCPSPSALEEVIRNRNLVVRQLNQMYQTIIVTTALSAAFIVLAKALKGGRLNINSLPFPQAIGTPPGAAGGLIFAQPHSTEGRLNELNDKLKELEEQNEGLSKSQLTSLVFLIAGTITVLALLQGIDKLSQECAQEAIDNDNGDGGNDNQFNTELTDINQGLLDLSAEQAEDGNPVISNTNGFILSVVTDDKNPVGTLKRRFAIAKDGKGVTLLKGQKSFSASDQILIDELIFYIQQNDLKAS